MSDTTGCVNPSHDHTTTQDPDGTSLAIPIPMRCSECHEPTHYDETIDDYQHDDPTAPECFLVYPSLGASPCTYWSGALSRAVTNPTD